MPIYTRTGDKGETSLFGGKRVLKCEELVDVYGSIDELNSWVGLLVTEIIDPDTKNFLQDIQADLFVIGGMLAGWEQGGVENLKICAEDMEVRIDVMEEKVGKLTHFILPGGTQPASFVHLARSIARRVERQIVKLRQTPSEHITHIEWDAMIQYVNRLSDLFFQLARFINNDAGVKDISWIGIPRDGKTGKK
jgi:cob(I)alamin adenosyltransferase